MVNSTKFIFYPQWIAGVTGWWLPTDHGNATVCNLTGMVYAAVCISGGTLGGLLFTNNVNNVKATNGGVILNDSESSLVASTFICNKAGNSRLLRDQVDIGCFEFVWPTAVLLR